MKSIALATVAILTLSLAGCASGDGASAPNKPGLSGGGTPPTGVVDPNTGLTPDGINNSNSKPEVPTGLTSNT